jgi:hypothetical protein
MLKPLSSAYSNQVAAFMERCQGLTSMSKRDFYPMCMAAWETSFKEETILKAFQATSLSPLEPEVILKRFNQPAQSDQSNDSDSSALSASDWRKIRQLVSQVVSNRDKRKEVKLNQTIHRLSVQLTLAQHKNVRLKEALINKRQLRKRGKPLLLQEPKEYHGGAVFVSPRKVDQARDRQHQQELEEEQLQHQKAEAARVREEQRQEKLKEVETRRAARIAARLMRQEEKAREATNRASRQAARRTQQRLQQAQKMPKGVRGEASRLLLRLIKKRGLSRGLEVVRCLMSLMWLLQPQPRAAGAQSELQCDFYSYMYQPRPIELTAKDYRDNIYCTWLNSLMFGDRFGTQKRALTRASR